MVATECISIKKIFAWGGGGVGGWGVHRTKLRFENTEGIDRFDGMDVHVMAILM